MESTVGWTLSVGDWAKSCTSRAETGRDRMVIYYRAIKSKLAITARHTGVIVVVGEHSSTISKLRLQQMRYNPLHLTKCEMMKVAVR